MRFVLDNSVAMRWLFGDGSVDDQTYADHVLQVLQDENSVAVVPGVWALEAGNVIVRAEARALLSEARSAEFLGTLQEMAIEVDSQTATHALADTLQLARRFKLSSYDAAYLELALRQGLSLATLDADLRRAAAQSGTPIV